MDQLLALICKELAEVPTEIQVIPYGVKVMTDKGPYTLDNECAEEVVNAFSMKKNKMVIDYEHQTLAGVQAPAAGWITKLINKGQEGVWAVVEWTEKARQYIANREYRYVSPVVLQNISDFRVRRLINVALTNQPNIDGMVPLVNKSGYFFQIENKEDKSMDKELLKALGLSETATMQDVIVAVNKLKEPVTIIANKSVLTALGLAESATEAEVTGTIMAMKQSHDQIGTLTTKLKTLEDSITATDAAEVVAQAMKEGKITPAQKEWADKYAKDDLAGFRVFVAKAPIIVPTNQHVDDDNGNREVVLDDVQLTVNKQMGIDDATFKKYNNIK